MTRLKHVLLALAVMAPPAAGVAQAQETNLRRIPPDGSTPLATLPQLGPEIDDALKTYIDPDPTTPLVGNTLQIKVAKLWDQHLWLNKDGSGYAFEASRSPSGPAITAQHFTWRVVKNGAASSLCRRVERTTADVCTPLQDGHRLYDEWFVTYDAETGSQAMRNVHQEYAILPGRK